MKPFPIPVVPFGPGSQALADEDSLPMPSLEPLTRGTGAVRATASERAAAAHVIERIVAAMRADDNARSPHARFALELLAPGALRALNESLGHGEVSAIVATGLPTESWHVQESAFCGLWRVQRVSLDGGVGADFVEWGEMPWVVREAARRGSSARLAQMTLPPGVMNAPAVLHEIRESARHVRPGCAAHVINLSHLPFNEADHAALDATLGPGYVTLLSRGFGNCRVASTGTPGVWRVQYFNSMSTLLLDTVEVVDLPEAAAANAEDFAESAERLADLARWLREAQA